MTEYLSVIDILSVIIIVLSAVILIYLINKTNSFAIFCAGFILFAIITLILLLIHTSELEKQLEKELDVFKNLDCKEMGNVILNNNLGGNKTFVKKAVKIFQKSGCQFDISKKIILDDLK